MKRGELRRLVIDRDRGCVISLIDAAHECRDRWGRPHPPTWLDKLTLEHVREHAGGRRREEPGWCVAVCYSANAHSHEASAERDAIRLYLAGVRAQTAYLARSAEDVVTLARRTGV